MENLSMKSNNRRASRQSYMPTSPQPGHLTVLDTPEHFKARKPSHQFLSADKERRREDDMFSTASQSVLKEQLIHNIE